MVRSGPANDALNKRQLEIERARDQIHRFIQDYTGSVDGACEFLNVHYRAGTLKPALRHAYEHAWDKKRSDNRLTKRTYYHWLKRKQKTGRSAPARREKDLDIKPWYGLLMALCQRPQGSCYKWIAEQITAQWDPAWGDQAPSYHAIRRVCKEKLSAIDQLKGRLTGSALRAHRHYQQRTSEGLKPSEEVHADGWNTHFTAPHPISGEWVTYEVWHFHDVATRYVTPPGIGLSETYEVITSGLENYVRTLGMMMILQTDSTKVIKRSPRFTQEPFTALEERAGFTVVHPKEVGNSQANGICENFNRSWLDIRSRELATYQGKGMDSLTLKRVKKITENMVKAANKGDMVEQARLRAIAQRTGKGYVFSSYNDAIDWILREVEAFNDKPHRSLPKVADPVTGKRRHQTPREALKFHVDAGWQPMTLTEDQIIDLFQPHVRCPVKREAVSPVGNGQRYYHPELGAWNDQDVMVAVDPMDPYKVRIKTLEGKFLFVADLVRATGYRAKSAYELAEEKRGKAQLKRIGKKVSAAERRMTPVLNMDVAPDQIFMPIGKPLAAVTAASVVTDIPADMPRIQPAPLAPARKARSDMTSDEIYAEWLEVGRALQAEESVSEQDRNFYRRWPESSQGKVWFKRHANGV